MLLSFLYSVNLPLKPSISKWVHLFIHLSLLSTCPYHLRQFNLSFDSKGARFNCPYIVGRLPLSSAFIVSIQQNIARLLPRRCCTCSLYRVQHLLAWSKVPLTQLSYNFPCIAKEFLVDVRRGSSSWNFSHDTLVHTTLTSWQPPPGQILSARLKRLDYIKLYAKVTCFSGLPSTGLQSLIYILHLYLGSAWNLPLKPLRFLCIHDWHPSQKIELLPTSLWHTPRGCFPKSFSECRFFPQIIILVFPCSL